MSAVKWLKRNKRRSTAGTSKPHFGEQQDSRSGFWALTGIILLLLVAWVLFAPGSGYLYYRNSQKELATIQQKNAELEQNNQIVFEYYQHNPNGSVKNIAGICNKEGNVLGMMPHPERAVEAILGGTDGLPLFKSFLKAGVLA